MEKEKLNLLLGEIQMYLDISEEEAFKVVEMVKAALIADFDSKRAQKPKGQFLIDYFSMICEWRSRV